ncbi:nucleotidyltransferase domain-containing protein [Candidatus Micrarchaeota archaeon]|nr:nucleotidyltransferase domain-containing protein [Candidatus Micrarchaeota archaeon]
MNAQMKKFVKDVKLSFNAKILLFGSRAKGKQKKGSDYDLIIVSDFFKGIPFADRAYHVWIRTKAAVPADIFCYAPSELKKTAEKSTVLKDALSYAIQL